MFRLVFFSCLILAISAFPYYYEDKVGRIVGGEEITIQQRPFQVSLLYNGGHYCGGSIVNEDTIVTAAHCAQNVASRYTVRVGSTSRTSGGQVVGVKSVTNHPKYNSATIDYDAAIIKLSSKLTFSSTVKAIQLAPNGYNVPDGASCYVSGWGTTSSGGSSPTNLRGVSVPTVNQSVCNAAYGSITSRMMCAGVTGKDSCQGDSGGPMTYNNYLVGIVSWGYGCASAGYPGVYAKVSALRDFLNQ